MFMTMGGHIPVPHFTSVSNLTWNVLGAALWANKTFAASFSKTITVAFIV
jgi:hypothetical protein